MNEEKLSKRLEAIANYIKPGARIADIGSDHAYLACHAVLKGIAKYAVAGEIAEGPLSSAKKQVLRCNLSDQIDVRKGDGLKVIKKEDELDTIIIAGMGGFLIRSILEKENKKLAGIKRLILQPNVAAWQLRIWAESHFFKLVSESILKEEKKIYEILVFERTKENRIYSEKERLFGPFLLQEKSFIFQKKWLREKKNWQQIIKNIASADKETKKNKIKIQELNAKIRLVKEVLK